MAGPGFIKVDVDGFELEVLRGAARTFREKCVDLLLETHSPALEQHSIEILQGFGLTTQIIKNSWYRSILREQRPSAHNRWLWASNRHLHNNAASK